MNLGRGVYEKGESEKKKNERKWGWWREEKMTQKEENIESNWEIMEKKIW